MNEADIGGLVKRTFKRYVEIRADKEREKRRFYIGYALNNYQAEKPQEQGYKTKVSRGFYDNPKYKLMG